MNSTVVDESLSSTSNVLFQRRIYLVLKAFRGILGNGLKMEEHLTVTLMRDCVVTVYAYYGLEMYVF